MGRRMTLFLIAAFVLTAGALLFDRVRPAIPPTAAASTPVARAAPNADTSLAVGCMDRIAGLAVEPPGWADLCWQAYQLTSEADPEKDYYVLRFYGSF